jgi:CRAL/TRIO domain
MRCFLWRCLAGFWFWLVPCRGRQSSSIVVVAKALASQCPTATTAECARFAAAHHPRGEKAMAASQLRHFLEWKDHAESMLQRYSGCSCVWEQCMRAAFADFSGCESTPAIESLPTCAFHPIVVVAAAAPAPKSRHSSSSSRSTGASADNNDDHHRILYVLPARMNFDVIPSELYTKVMTYFWLKVYNGRDPCTVLIDARGGRGWPNMSFTRMQAWLRSCSTTLCSYFPGGLHQAVIYPVPAWVVRLWRIIISASLLPADVQASVVLLSGQNSSYHAPYPTGLHFYVAASVLGQLEHARQSSFVKS